MAKTKTPRRGFQLGKILADWMMCEHCIGSHRQREDKKIVRILFFTFSTTIAIVTAIVGLSELYESSYREIFWIILASTLVIPLHYIWKAMRWMFSNG